MVSLKKLSTKYWKVRSFMTISFLSPKSIDKIFPSAYNKEKAMKRNRRASIFRKKRETPQAERVFSDSARYSPASRPPNGTLSGAVNLALREEEAHSMREIRWYRETFALCDHRAFFILSK